MDAHDLIKQIADRARRTETRVTMIAHHLGVDAGGEKPTWEDGNLFIPSPMCSLKDCIAAVPGHFREGVDVFVRDGKGREDYLTSLHFER